MSYMTFQKYSFNDDVYLLFDEGCNQDVLTSEIFRRLQYSNFGSGISGIIDCSLFGETMSAPRFMDIEGKNLEDDRDAFSVYRYYMNNKKDSVPHCEKTPFCEGCLIKDEKECAQCIRNTGRIYMEHVTQA